MQSESTAAIHNTYQKAGSGKMACPRLRLISLGATVWLGSVVVAGCQFILANKGMP